EAIEAYARQHRLRWVDDDSNADERFARNRLRLRVWPALVAAFDDAEAALAAAAARSAHASAVLDEVGASDAAMVAGDDGLDLAAWQRLSLPRRRQVLVSWLRQTLAAAPPSSLVERLLREATVDGHRSWPAADRELRSYHGRLQWVPIASPDGDPGRLVVDLSHPGLHEVAAWRGAFRVDAVAHGGIPAAAAARLVLRARSAGDTFQAGPRRPARSLKLQYQASGIAPALRRGPIVCGNDDAPVFVPGLGIDARAVAPRGEAQVALAWLPAHDAERASESQGEGSR
ncbi:MAG TPA: TilS substrate C-terminal domain-containing protein, partial [Caldimonas sp.]